MTTTLLSHLSYADFNARLDALRKVMICPAPNCEERAPWTNAAQATVLGWTFEDRNVDGKTVRFWFCPEHRVADSGPVLPPRMVTRTRATYGLSMKDLCALPFSELRLVLVRLGMSAGTQLAVVMHEDRRFWRVLGWKASSRRWIAPKDVAADKVLATPPSTDKRIKAASKEWPPRGLGRN